MPAFALITLDTLTSHGNSPRYGKMSREELRPDNLLERAAPNVSLVFKVIFQQLVLTRKLILLAARACTYVMSRDSVWSVKLIIVYYVVAV